MSVFIFEKSGGTYETNYIKRSSNDEEATKSKVENQYRLYLLQVSR
ncbi:Hypothetical protein ACI5QL_03009 [Bacillus velezensis]